MPSWPPRRHHHVRQQSPVNLETESDMYTSDSENGGSISYVPDSQGEDEIMAGLAAIDASSANTSTFDPQEAFHQYIGLFLMPRSVDGQESGVQASTSTGYSESQVNEALDEPILAASSGAGHNRNEAENTQEQGAPAITLSTADRIPSETISTLPTSNLTLTTEEALVSSEVPASDAQDQGELIFIFESSLTLV